MYYWFKIYYLNYNGNISTCIKESDWYSLQNIYLENGSAQNIIKVEKIPNPSEDK